MKRSRIAALCLIFAFIAALPVFLSAQGTKADYDRAFGLREKWQGLVLDVAERPVWIEKTHKIWYRKSVKGGTEFFLADADTASKAPAFDHEKLAAALAAELKEKVDPKRLPFNAIGFADGMKSLTFEAFGSRWKADLVTYVLTKLGPVERRGGQADGWQDLASPVPPPASDEIKASPDGAWEAFTRNWNVFVRTKDKKEEFPLTWDGSEGNFYAFSSIVWSPDSTRLAAYRIRPGFRRIVHYVESSPADQLQPKHRELRYSKPGDALDIEQPVLLILDGRKKIDLDPSLFPNPYDLSTLVWRKDSRAFTFEYNQRGHQVFRVLEAAAADGAVRAVVSEEPKTFFTYSGKKYRSDIADGKEVVWMSERDGWNHLYLYDSATGRVKNQITKGEWVVRGIDKVDEEARVVWFQASGLVSGQDPYFTHACRINLDGTGFTVLTEGDFTHSVAYAADMTLFADLYSRVDQPPVLEIRRTSDRSLVMGVEKGNAAELVKAGWKAPEVFTAKGRDGRTDIWGVIFRPTNFDTRKKYPVIENIYAGPHSSFVPKTFVGHNGMQSLAELGFIVIQVDGMGTSNRSKAFHDIAWKNIGDAGFPDRILWHKAVAAKYPYYDITRVGIYGTSAGGQNALGGLLFHPEFYKAGAASCGCHDNRMDKIWWNEAWMGWPLGPEYAASSNVDNAHKLQGKLLLILGEMDTNVDPSSTMQVVNALIKADKMFDFLVIPGANHTSGGAYGDRKRYDFFVQNLLGVRPPDWNKPAPVPAK